MIVSSESERNNSSMCPYAAPRLSLPTGCVPQHPDSCLCAFVVSNRQFECEKRKGTIAQAGAKRRDVAYCRHGSRRTALHGRKLMGVAIKVAHASPLHRLYCCLELRSSFMNASIEQSQRPLGVHLLCSAWHCHTQEWPPWMPMNMTMSC